MVWKTLVAQQRTNAQLNLQNGSGRVSNQGHLGERPARGERDTHKPTMPPAIGVRVNVKVNPHTSVIVNMQDLPSAPFKASDICSCSRPSRNFSNGGGAPSMGRGSS